MSFSEREDILEEYQIPITPEEYQKIVETKYEDLSLKFLAGRNARVIHEGGTVKIESDFALRRCGRSGLWLIGKPVKWTGLTDAI